MTALARRDILDFPIAPFIGYNVNSFVRDLRNMSIPNCGRGKKNTSYYEPPKEPCARLDKDIGDTLKALEGDIMAFRLPDKENEG